MLNQVKKPWEAPTVEILDINSTMFGAGKKYVDMIIYDGDETVELNSNKNTGAPQIIHLS